MARLSGGITSGEAKETEAPGRTVARAAVAKGAARAAAEEVGGTGTATEGTTKEEAKVVEATISSCDSEYET